jgi:hypothetical protein
MPQTIKPEDVITALLRMRETGEWQFVPHGAPAFASAARRSVCWCPRGATARVPHTPACLKAQALMAQALEAL